MKTIDIVIIGGGSAGMSAALRAHRDGCRDMLLIERDGELGGILQQCIHNGFGLQLFQEELSGPAFAQRLSMQMDNEKIPYLLNTTVLSISQDRIITYCNAREGIVQVQAKAIVLASGCYERSRGAISLPGMRGKGIYTAGSAQRFLNIENVLVGKRIFILGSGDIGLIMARRMTLSGAKVLGVAELMPYSNGLTRNLVQCLQDFDIPLYLSHTIINTEGNDKLEAVSIAQVDAQGKPIEGSIKRFEVDTLLLSVGLIPETSLLQPMDILIDAKTKGAKVDEHYQTNIAHIYACGNALHVHDLVDFVAMEAELTGHFAMQDLMTKTQQEYVECVPKHLVSYVVPQRIHRHLNESEIMLSFRVKKPCYHVEIQITNQRGICKRIKKAVLLPAEMVRLSIATDILQDSEYLHVEVRDEQ